MWWEILPGIGIMIGLLTVSGSTVYFGQKLRNGGKLQREIKSRFDWQLKKRDDKIAGKWYGVKGLEYLPDKSP